MSKTTKERLLRGMTAGMVCLLLAGCALFQKTPPAKAPRQQHVDVKAQQHYYDIGLQHYSKENYGEARDAFEKVIEFGPATSLGIKAQENLKKIQRILKTLDEIESK
jgi:outer membrane protein assembly factor BamD (BamD/ComL family)